MVRDYDLFLENTVFLILQLHFVLSRPCLVPAQTSQTAPWLFPRSSRPPFVSVNPPSSVRILGDGEKKKKIDE